LNSILCTVPAVLALLASCGAPRKTPTPLEMAGAYPGELRPPSTLGIDVVWRQSVDATWAERTEGFDAAVQVRGDTLLVLALSPVGQPGLVLRLNGTEVSVENPSGMEFPIPARFVLLDVQRVFFPWFEGEPPITDGERMRQDADERVDERWVDGHLVERRFARTSGEPSGEIRVTYEWANKAWFAPTRAVLENGWCGYQLEIRTHEETVLPTAAADS
jgi:hypothetical protein